MKHYLHSSEIGCGNENVKISNIVRIENILDVTCGECKKSKLYKEHINMLINLGITHLNKTYVKIDNDVVDENINHIGYMLDNIRGIIKDNYKQLGS